MSVTNVTAHGAALTQAGARREHGRSAREQFARLQVGQTLDLKVMQRIDDKRVMAYFDGTTHLVETAMELTAGTTARVSVVSVGDKLELRYLDSGANAGRLTTPGVQDEDEQAGEEAERLSDLQAEYAVRLHADERQRLIAAMSAASEPDQMARSGLYLSKLSEPLRDHSLRAVYGALSWLQPSAVSERRALDATALSDVAGADSAPTADVAAALADVLAGTASEGTELSSSGDEKDAHDLARRLLNEQDGGSTAYTFGRLPLMVSDQLVELDVVLFRDRQGAAARHSTRRLVMSLKTEALGRVEVMAQAVGERLTIAVSTESADASNSLSKYADDVRALVSKLGWHVDTIRYDVGTPSIRAAGHIVRHVLDAGTIDRMF